MRKSVMIAAGFVLFASAAGRAACIAIGDGDDAGCLPPDRTVARCEAKFANEATSLWRGLVACHEGLAKRPNVFAEEACEDDRLVRYDERVGRLALRRGCPPCLAANAGALRDQVLAFADAANQFVYCAGTVPFGGDDTGFLPPDNLTLYCERRLGMFAVSLWHGMDKCHAKMVDQAVRGRSFDEAGCEAKAQLRFELLRAAYLSDHPHCPACVGASALNTLIEPFLDSVVNGASYCAPAS